MQQWIKEVARGKRGSKNLSYEETMNVAHSILSGEATDAQTTAYLIAMRLITETSDELLAFQHALENYTTKLEVSEKTKENLIDFASPYTGRNSFLATIPVSLLLADQGIPVFLHSTDSLPPKYAVTINEVLEKLGVNVSLSKETLASSIENVKIGFAKTDAYCLPLRDLRKIREEIGVRTLFNTAEKLLNISGAKSIMAGAFHRTAIKHILPVFEKLSFERVYIVQGVEGSEDLPVHRNSFIFSYQNGETDSFIVKPEEFGLFHGEGEKKRIPEEEQANIVLSLLNGEKLEEYAYYYNQVVFNTGIRYYLFNLTNSIEDGIDLAKGQLREKRGFRKLEEWRLVQ
ncbi:anthranilate phosphoribosyltransferase [Metabacillus arenae]|uniref:Anthranilate phosphoribosyltransferase n=1 Tax=Metabacillus arenae TaxID=2771434 RepID=A0A926N8Q1_9BACI|nr:anthranilate phosphoribosyltransferase [Metabacillus arenae]MBD1379537.1 anthranilate phosphoribosyltransferase [Metabacillus arenae]